MQWLNRLDSKATEHQYADTRQYREAFPVKVERCSYTILKPLQDLFPTFWQAKGWFYVVRRGLLSIGLCILPLRSDLRIMQI